MFKKILSVIACLLPFGANAVIYHAEDYAPNWNPGADKAVGLDGNLYGINSVVGDNDLAVESGYGLVLTDNADAAALGHTGLILGGGLGVGINSPAGVGGGLFFETQSVPRNFTLYTNGNIQIAQNVTIADGYGLEISKVTQPVANLTIGGDIIADNAYFSATNIGTLKAGDVTVGNGLVINANTVNVDTIKTSGGNSTVTLDDVIADVVANSLTTTSIVNTNAGVAKYDTETMSVGTIQNLNGSMQLDASTSLTATGNIENSGALMEIVAGDVSVAGTMKNDSKSGSFVLEAANWSIMGGGDSAASFVNSGNFSATVTGTTHLENGFNLSGMKENNSFKLVTGKLTFGDAISADALLQLFNNKVSNDFTLSIEQGGIDIATQQIINGFVGEGVVNPNAVMNLSAQTINVASVQNYAGTMNVTANTTTGDALNIVGNVSGVGTQAITKIVSGANLVVGGAVSNAGTMTLNGINVKIDGDVDGDNKLMGVSNTGTLKITAPTDASGAINIAGNVTNISGTTELSARQITVGGVLNNMAGQMNVLGSDTAGDKLTVGGVTVSGGTVDMTGLIGGIAVTDASTGANGLISVTGGALNIGQATHTVTATNAISIGGNFTASDTAAVSGGNGNVNVAVVGQQFVLQSTKGNINIGGNVTATDTTKVHNALLDANLVSIGGDVTAAGLGRLTLGANTSQTLMVTGDVLAGDNVVPDGSTNASGAIEIFAANSSVGSLTQTNGLITSHGGTIAAKDGQIYITNGTILDSDSIVSGRSQGLVVKGADSLTLQSKTDDIYLLGGTSVATGKTLTVDAGVALNSGAASAQSVTMAGIINNSGVIDVTAGGNVEFDNTVTNSGTFTVVAADSINAAVADFINNSGDMVNLTATNGDVTLGAIENDGIFNISGGGVSTRGIDVNNGNLAVTANNLNVASLAVLGGVANITANTFNSKGDVRVTSGNLVQGMGGTAGALNLKSVNYFEADSLNISNGAFVANSGATMYEIGGDFTVANGFTIDNGASATIIASTIDAGNAALVNNGMLSLNSGGSGDITVGVVTNTGNLTLNGMSGTVNIAQYVNNTGTLNLGKLALDGALVSTGAITTIDTATGLAGTLYQGYNGVLAAGDINVLGTKYSITASNISVAAIDQRAGALVLNTSDLYVAGDMSGTDISVRANPATNWLNVNVLGNVSGGTEFIGLESMHVGQNFVFDNSSKINAAILPYAAGSATNSAFPNYWSSISLNDDNTLGIITNAADGNALIDVDGKFVSNLTAVTSHADGAALGESQVGIVLKDIVDQGTAIWFVHAAQGVEDWATKLRNVNVSFCNADGTLCYNYLDSLDANNDSDDDLPVYLSERDIDGDGKLDSLYIVFDPRFGGPVEVFQIQPIVGRVDTHTAGEYLSAGALDNMVTGALIQNKFFNSTPIEVIPLMFRGTGLAGVADALYDRMEYYNTYRDGTGLARFSRLFQARELEQVAGMVSLNEHTSFRSFEDRMFDEFIWNRNRNLKKAWLDVDYGLFVQDVSEENRIDGRRFSISGGFDWQESETLVLGLTGRISRSSSSDSDAMDLSYKPGENIDGFVHMNVKDTNVGLGGYLMKTLGQKTRAYGNAFLDIHVFDIDREQTYVGQIDGDGTDFAITSEWGLMHDLLNQYIVGNIYARAGYNFGFSIKEQVGGKDYMNMESDGYLFLTPGYSLTAQKRIYPSAWFQIRPYATIGIEYDVLGAPDKVKYKFASALSYTDYAVDIDPMWANVGGGFEFLSATGIQVGIDYRYQYNDALQLHNIKVSGSYRF